MFKKKHSVIPGKCVTHQPSGLVSDLVRFDLAMDLNILPLSLCDMVWKLVAISQQQQKEGKRYSGMFSTEFKVQTHQDLGCLLLFPSEIVLLGFLEKVFMMHFFIKDTSFITSETIKVGGVSSKRQ